MQNGFLSTPVLMHGGLLYIAFRLSVHKDPRERQVGSQQRQVASLLFYDRNSPTLNIYFTIDFKATKCKTVFCYFTIETEVPLTWIINLVIFR